MSDESVIIYESTFCPYCTRAKKLLDNKGVSYTQINVDRNPGDRQDMQSLSGQKTVPQIFFGKRHIGGYDDLFALKCSGELDQLLYGETND